MIHKLWKGFWLVCPRCEKGHITQGFLNFRETCEVCNLKYERRSGESAGASIVWISILPIFALMIFFALYFSNPEASMWVLLGIPLAFVVIVGVSFYRNIRGMWIAVTYLTDGAKEDDSTAQSRKY